MSASTKNKNKFGGERQSAVDFLLASADKIDAELPTPEIKKLLADGSQNLDHYLYGALKQ